MKAHPTKVHSTKGIDEWRQYWPVPFVSALGLMVGAIYIYSLGVFIEPIQEEYGWSRTQISFGLTLVSIVTVCLSPFMGLIIDRLGARTLALPGMVIYCLAIALLSTVSGNVWFWWAGWLLVALGSVCIKPTVWAAAVSTYFNTGRGLAIAVALCGTGLGQALLPFVTNELVRSVGWQTAYLVLGLGGAVLALPVMYFFFYDKRERNKRNGRTSEKPESLPGLNLREGFRSRHFIFLVLTALLATTGIVGIVVHFVPILSAGGLDRSVAAAIAGVIGLASMTGRVVSGYLLDKMNGWLVGACAYGIPSIACLLLLQFDGSATQAILLAIIIGLSLGAEIDILAYLASRYFGLKNYGTLFGTVVGFTTLGAGIGPLALGAVFDATNSYSLGLWILIPLFLFTSMLVASLGPYPTFEISPNNRATNDSLGNETAAVSTR